MEGKEQERGKSSRGRILNQHLGAMTASNTGLIIGLALGWTSAAVSVAEGAQGFPISLEEWSWVTSSYTLGAALGASIVGLILRSLGRRMVILLVAPVTAAAWALHVWADQVWMLVAGRVALGVATGAGSVAVPVYVCEMSLPHIRGALSTYFEVLLCLGIVLVYIMGKWVPVFWINIFCMAYSVFHGASFIWFPDTPRWFLLHNRRDDAVKAMAFYRGESYDVESELQAIQSTLESSSRETTGLAAFGTRAARKGLFICVTLLVLQQVTGVNAVTFYASTLFQAAGSFDAHIASIIVAITELIAACVSMVFVDRLGRRMLLLISGTFMCVCTGMLGGYFYVKTETDTDVTRFSWLPIIFVSVFMFTFSIGLGPVSWVLLGEIFPDNIKSAASSLATTACWLAAFLVTKFYPSLREALGEHVCYWIFCGLCALACVFFLLMPETKGRTLDEIQEDLSAGRKKKRKPEGVRM